VPGKRRSKALAAFSDLPIAAAIDATKAYGAGGAIARAVGRSGARRLCDRLGA
jgi:hypothetical protein